MLNYTTIGVAAWVGSFILLILHVISTLTNSSSLWGEIKLVDLVPFNPIRDFSLLGIDNAFNLILHIPLFAFLFLVGILVFIVNGVFGTK